MTWSPVVLCLVMGYLLGAIPFGYLIGRLRGVDVRRVGSGRTGGTNVFRAAGPLAAAATVLGDALKAMAAVGLARLLFTGELHAVMAGIGAVAGHNWPVFLRFRGGAGGITSLAALGALSLPAGLGVSLLALGAVIWTRYASVGSLTIAVGAPLALFVMAWLGGPTVHLIFGLVAGGMIVYSLRPNIARLRQGSERRIGGK